MSVGAFVFLFIFGLNAPKAGVPQGARGALYSAKPNTAGGEAALCLLTAKRAAGAPRSQPCFAKCDDRRVGFAKVRSAAFHGERKRSRH